MKNLQKKDKLVRRHKKKREMNLKFGVLREVGEFYSEKHYIFVAVI